MNRMIPLLLFLGFLPGAALAENTSVYTPFDLKTCTQVQKPDEYVFEGAWKCKGIEGYEIFQSGVDARSYAAFGKKDSGTHCAALKTFSPFNTALSPIEWRLKDGKPIAAIERWSVTDADGIRTTWLVVNALRENESCQAHYVAGSYPNANEAARRAADSFAEKFDCETGIPTFDSEIGVPPIELNACKDLARE
ncbi:MAG: hypothetical protein ACKVP5_14700 [Aestuariivirga sp.]